MQISAGSFSSQDINNEHLSDNSTMGTQHLQLNATRRLMIKIPLDIPNGDLTERQTLLWGHRAARG